MLRFTQLVDQGTYDRGTLLPETDNYVRGKVRSAVELGVKTGGVSHIKLAVRSNGLLVWKSLTRRDQVKEYCTYSPRKEEEHA